MVVYDEPTPLAVIDAAAPGRAGQGRRLGASTRSWAASEVEEAGGRVVRVDLVRGRSTSAIVERIQAP